MNFENTGQHSYVSATPIRSPAIQDKEGDYENISAS
jgi:hypothetical protein